MTVVYPACPACGAEQTSRPLYTGEGSYPHGVFHEHSGCEVSKYIVVVHPDGEVESEIVVPGDRRFEEFGRAS